MANKNLKLEVALPSFEDALKLCEEVKKVNLNYTIVFHCLAPHFNKQGMNLGKGYQEKMQKDANINLPMYVIHSDSELYNAGDKVFISAHTTFLRSITKDSEEMYEIIGPKTTQTKETPIDDRRNKRYLMSIIYTNDILYSTNN